MSTRTGAFAPPHAAQRRVLPYLAVALAASGWGTWPVVLRYAESLGPMPAAFESTVVLAVVTLVSGLAMLGDRMGRRPDARAIGLIVVLGVTDAFNVLLFFSAYQITVSVAVLAHYLTPVLVAVAAPLALGERLTWRTMVAVVASLAGLGLLVARGAGPLATDAVLLCAGLGAASAVFYASNVIANKFVAYAFTTSEAIFYHGLVATPVLAACVPHDAWAAIHMRAAATLGGLAVGPGAGSALVFLWGLRGMPAAHASTLTLIEPLVAVLLGAALFGETLGARAVLGAALILGGALLVVTQATAPRRPMAVAADA